jgi:BirA family biotin operon repressor/biotin-[acetyl-CoA-carboxylase] ligase
LAAQFADWLSRWRASGLEPVRRAWLAAAHPVGTRLSTPEGEGSFEGLEPGGALRLRLVDGGIRLVHAGDVFLL